MPSPYRLRDMGRETARGGLSAITIGIAVVVVVIAVGLVGVFGFGWFQQGTADFRGKTQQKNRVNGNGAYRIAAYDHFFDLCASVQSNEQSVANLREELDSKSSPTPERALQIRASITALRNQRAETITQYNGDARESYTQGQFRSSNLPFQLDIKTKETSCVA